MNGSDKIIPLRDLDTPTTEEVFVTVTEQIAQLLSRGPAPVMFVRLDENFQMDMACMADDSQIVSMAMGLVTMLGANKIGEQGMNSFPDQRLAQITAQVTGLRILNKMMDDQVSAVDARTPATDAGRDRKDH
jgi:hypothetical protein